MRDEASRCQPLASTHGLSATIRATRAQGPNDQRDWLPTQAAWAYVACPSPDGFSTFFAVGRPNADIKKQWPKYGRGVASQRTGAQGGWRSSYQGLQLRAPFAQSPWQPQPTTKCPEEFRPNFAGPVLTSQLHKRPALACDARPRKVWNTPQPRHASAVQGRGLRGLDRPTQPGLADRRRLARVSREKAWGEPASQRQYLSARTTHRRHHRMIPPNAMPRIAHG